MRKLRLVTITPSGIEQVDDDPSGGYNGSQPFSIRNSGSVLWSAIMKRANSDYWPGQNSLLASIVLVGMFLAGGLERRAVAGDAKLPADLDLVPRNAVGFVHVRAADLWHTDMAKELRYFVDKAGPEAWKAFAKKSPIDPKTMDRVTLIWLSPQMNDPFPTADPEAMSVLVVVSTTKPFNRPSVIQSLGAKEKVYRDNLYYFNEELWSGLFLVDDRTFVLGSEESLIRLLEMSRQKDRTGPLEAPLLEAARKHHAVLGLNPTILGKQPGAGFLPPSAQTLLTAHSAVVSLDLGDEIRLNARLEFLNENQARDGETAARQTLDLARQGLAQPIAELEKVMRDPDKNAATDLPQHFAALVALGFLREVDSQLKEAPLQRQGSAVNLALKYKNHAAAPLAVTGLATTFLAGRYSNKYFDRFDEKRDGPDPVELHLRAVSKAFEAYREKHGVYPPSAIYDRDGRPTLSWRVALLPYLGEEALYREFKLDEPWDSLHNKRLLKRLPKSLQVANDYYRYGSTRWKTTTQVITGTNTVFDGAKGVRQADVTQKAILLVRLANNEGVYWTKPADISYAAGSPLPNFYGKYGDRAKVLLTDGTFRTIERSLDEKAVRALIERSDKPLKVKSPPQLGELETIWNSLTQNDDAGTKKAWQGIVAMSKIPEKAVPYVNERVKPAPTGDEKRIAQCLLDLESNIFKKRAQAIAELEAFGELALPAIDKKLADKSYSLEARRQLDALAQKVKTVLSGDDLRSVRAVEILEQAGTPDARAVLANLSRGGEGAVLTQQARRALARLAQRSGGS